MDKYFKFQAYAVPIDGFEQSFKGVVKASDERQAKWKIDDYFSNRNFAWIGSVYVKEVIDEVTMI
ncbi:hypothetical protein CON15_19520 [Bacillus cereus]|uniref:Phage protein n=1 Tax=Bacillus thuringiensis TaxID=1428 RepID=A0AB36VG51_BACTU|nr:MULTISPECIES: hypothetical protein [Bacillus cereus group]MEC0031096.1 hypothetical protein [Bacillus cereus]PDZ55732.1 hypothetical protein CON15_19520 [Bacillus cereus]PFO26192.1 hypothetical protein COJ78_29255 [Bacillus thuringiensis]PFS40352.1 hypothetical protein COK48_00475 [Bacillus thuringiensis]PFS58191.1 hypothetical protein COK64_17580 [Bacillus thuringiensis]